MEHGGRILKYMSKEAQPKVSVAMVTYKHEKFIAQAIESVMMQKTKFQFELVIGEDCSPDKTREIVLAYERKYPAQIRVLPRKANLGVPANGIETCQSCRGRYMAILEGDDYWTDPDKLQSQVDFLDSNPDFSISYHDVLIAGDRSGGFPEQWCQYAREVSTIEDLAFCLYIPTCSAVIRNGFVKEFPAWFYELGMGEWPLFLLVAQHGKIHFTDRIMAHYRRHAGGIWTGQTGIRNSEKMLKAVRVLNAAFDHRFEPMFRAQEFWCWCDLAVKHEELNDAAEAARFRSLARCRALRHLPSLLRIGWQPKGLKLNVMFRLFFPRAWAACRGVRNVLWRQKPA